MREMKKLAPYLVIAAVVCLWSQSLVSQDDLFSDTIDESTDLADDTSLGGDTLDDPQAQFQAEFRRANEAADSLMKDQKFNEAITEFNKVLALDRTYAPAHFGRARCFQAVGSKEDAIAAYSRAITSPGATNYQGLVPQSYLERGKLFLETGRYREAVDDFTQTVDQDPTNPEHYYQQGKALLRQVLTSAGGGADQSGQRNLMAAMSALTRAIDMKSDYGEAFLERGRVLSRIREATFAIDDLTVAVQLMGGTSQAAADLGLAYSARANQESTKADGDNQKIVDDLQASIDSMSGFLQGATYGERQKPWETSDPTEVRPEGVLLSRAENKIALANELEGERQKELYESALSDCDRVLSLDVNPLELARAHFSRGHAKRMLRDLEGAIESYTDALSQFPTYTEAYLRRGICYFHQEAYDEALQDFVAASNDPRDPYRPESRALYWSGLTNARIGEHQQAIRDYTRALEAAPDYIAVYLNRGLSYINMGRYDQAIEDFNNVLRRDRDHADAIRFRDVAVQRRESES